MFVRFREQRPNAHKRGYDETWKRRRLAILAERPYCETCQFPATEVHHVVPLAAGGTHDDANLQALCKTCHSRITASEQRSGYAKKDAQAPPPDQCGY